LARHDGGRRPGVRRLAVAAVLAVLAACSPTLQPMGPPVAVARLTDDTIVASDGVALPLRRWMPDGPPRAVLLALHGFNDYSNAFDAPGRWFAARGIAVYAYDQRGFGRAPQPGIWAGADTLVADFEAAAASVRARHRGVPFFVLGESMGGAVIMAALAGHLTPEPLLPRSTDVRTAGTVVPLAGRAEGSGMIADGVILSAPAVWATRTMPVAQRAALWVTKNTVPWLALSAPRELNIWPSDNVEMLRALGRDPLVIKATRIDAMAGLTDLMSRAFDAAPRLEGPPTLVLFGQNEQVIPKRPIAETLARLPRDRNRVAVYDTGWHMLLRDLKAETVLHDVAAWIADPAAPLPSGADGRRWPGS
jgi:alpha-beta hydrolase superfamily lysophospholipase